MGDQIVYANLHPLHTKTRKTEGIEFNADNIFSSLFSPINIKKESNWRIIP